MQKHLELATIISSFKHGTLIWDHLHKRHTHTHVCVWRGGDRSEEAAAQWWTGSISLWSQIHSISTNTDSVFVLNCYIIDYELSIMHDSLLRGIPVQNHKEMSCRWVEPTRTIRFSSGCLCYPALLLITTSQLLILMIIRGCERLKHRGIYLLLNKAVKG